MTLMTPVVSKKRIVLEAQLTQRLLPNKMVWATRVQVQVEVISDSFLANALVK